MIKLTLQNGEPILINMDQVECITRITEATYPGCGDSANLTGIMTNGAENPYIVRETVDDIMERIARVRMVI